MDYTTLIFQEKDRKTVFGILVEIRVSVLACGNLEVKIDNKYLSQFLSLIKRRGIGKYTTIALKATH